MAYKMTHPDSSQEIEVVAGLVAVMESQGWETSPSANPPADPEPAVASAPLAKTAAKK